MKLPGRLRLTTLGDVLGALHRESASGILELTEDHGARHRVYFEAGLVRDVETTLSRVRLGELLAEQGFLGAAALTRLARWLIERPGQRAGEILVQEGLLSPEIVSAGLRRQLRSKLDALFLLRDARVAFHVPRPRVIATVPLSPGEFLHGRPRARSAPGTRPPRPGTETDSSQRARASTAPRPASGADARAYATLGLLPGADRDSVQRAFRRLAARMHPDRYPQASATEKAYLLSRFAELSAAYHALAR